MMICWPASLALGFLLLAANHVAHAQASPPAAPAILNIFLDCNSCDGDFVRTEINYVNWVRDRQVSDVHLLVTAQSTGGGGTEYTLALIGLRSQAGLTDTLHYVAPQQSTPDLTRRGMTRLMQLGLARFLARTTMAERFNLTVAPAPANANGASATPSQQVKDPWNFWVLTVSGSGNTSGEKQSTFNALNGGLGARRTTNNWKINLSARQSYNESKFNFDLPDGTTRTTTSIRRSLSFSELAVKSLGPKFSAGLVSSAGSSTFENKNFYFRVTPAVEYDLVPYSESTRRMLTVQYSAGIERNRYKEETIYFKTDETNPLHSVNVNLSQTQPWGSANVGISGSQYLNDTQKNAASVFASTNVRILKGLSFSLSGSYSSIHNQIYLPRRGATDEEVLLRQRSLQTSYSYFGFASINYTFGSIFNNVVNPRFGGGSMVFF
jgi:hypothetical protein